MATESPARRFWTRETRLLLITVALSVAVLLVLARFRFPDQEPLELPTQPLQRLAARAAFDDLSTAVARAADRVRPSLRVVPMPAALEARSFGVEEVLAGTAEPSSAPPLALAYRFRNNAALLLTQAPVGPAVDSVAGFPVLATDDVRGLAVLGVREEAGESWAPLSVSNPLSPQYLLLAEPTRAGVAIRPLFGGAADPFVDPHWNGPILALGRDVHAPDGAFVFSLEGSLVGAVVNRYGVQAIVPADTLLRAAERLMSDGRRTTGSIGVRLQRLGPALMTATGVRSGAVVTRVAPDGPAASLLEPGDVIVSVGGRPVDSPEAALLAIARHPAPDPVPIGVHRAGHAIEIHVTPVALRASEADGAASELGAILRPSPAGARVQSVTAGGGAASAGLREGDVITWVADVKGPSPQRVSAAWQDLAAGQSLLVGITRGEEPLVLALRKPAAADREP
jgi:hypothetical protein